MRACHILLVCWNKLKKIPKFHHIGEYQSQQELSDSLLLELMNPQSSLSSSLRTSPGEGKRYSVNTGVCWQEEIRSPGNSRFSPKESKSSWHYRAIFLPSTHCFPVLALSPSLLGSSVLAELWLLGLTG